MTGWRNVRVFLSSTFRDMHAERDRLVKVTFPALREKLLPHRVELYDIDLRWGITEVEATNERVIRLCLEQIDECRPFFLGVSRPSLRLGTASVCLLIASEKYPFVARLPGISVTELELRHGVINDPVGNAHSRIAALQRATSRSSRGRPGGATSLRTTPRSTPD